MYDVIIVGAGVAGFTAALFAARRGLKVLVIGKDLGGQANYTDLIENYPGLEQIGGLELVKKIRAQAQNYGAEFVISEVSKISAKGGNLPFFVVSAYGSQYKAQGLILAYGKTPRDLGVPGENELKGRGVSYCANCDAPLYKNKTVAVVGVGDIAADAALMLSKYAKKLYILSKTDKFNAHPALSKALFGKANVELVIWSQVQQILGENQVSGMKIQDLKTGKIRELAVEGIFVELGYVINSKIVQNVVELDEQEQIVVNADQSTSVPGMFAAGDATSSLYKQAVISAGEAATAALAAYDYLMRQKGGVGLTSDWTQIKKLK
ncbi:MAG: hypothetical protein A3B10_00265 [Candidatus Doudnabacteria bacterium RIFCSPLOWO2_01_FULL_44_21]|uniref:FAD/NAD(P)-binding domain-containing protein n=1 Tax=Candidatus Doudnabacteria bacterium RIFCSPLOWO2_01_FULL_44_21 TaxID=1817841 RepID=A0A1F5PXC0_9BACT|nr:MAG: hypothetical protein A3B95_03720 [Candidatus Doudnabacteria bacterium RIFCSPHIGHO2_02_FULL_43_13b]OGE94581.1 MAG: hypothetical protein A3B10_00265 [Candidatus Doudnabacteria bacterium RIFCSPLOWO2_01_FULL_44_21]